MNLSTHSDSNKGWGPGEKVRARGSNYRARCWSPPTRRVRANFARKTVKKTSRNWMLWKEWLPLLLWFVILSLPEMFAGCSQEHQYGSHRNVILCVMHIKKAELQLLKLTIHSVDNLCSCWLFFPAAIPLYIIFLLDYQAQGWWYLSFLQMRRTSSAKHKDRFLICSRGLLTSQLKWVAYGKSCKTITGQSHRKFAAVAVVCWNKLSPQRLVVGFLKKKN